VPGFGIGSGSDDGVSVATEEQTLGARVETANGASQISLRHLDGQDTAAGAVFDVVDQEVVLPVGSAFAVNHFGHPFCPENRLHRVADASISVLLPSISEIFAPLRSQ
jgi:hypothetical protein